MWPFKIKPKYKKGDTFILERPNFVDPMCLTINEIDDKYYGFKVYFEWENPQELGQSYNKFKPFEKQYKNIFFT